MGFFYNGMRRRTSRPVQLMLTNEVTMKNEFHSPQRSWLQKFYYAFRGIALGTRRQSSFVVHAFAAVAVVIAATVLQVGLTGWCLLTLCITIVLTAEMFNSALERMAKAIDVQQNLHLADALDISSAAVLIASLGAVVIGGIVLLPKLAVLLNWW